MQDAIVDLRVLHEAPPAGGTRLIGYVRKPEVFRGVLQRPIAPNLAAGARVDVIGAEGTRTVTTDQTGIYQLDGLPAGDYELRLVIPESQVDFWGREGAKVYLNGSGVVEHSFNLLWNGRIVPTWMVPTRSRRSRQADISQSLWPER